MLAKNIFSIEQHLAAVSLFSYFLASLRPTELPRRSLQLPGEHTPGLLSFLASLLLSHLRLCLYISNFLVNDFRQISHMNGFSPVMTGEHASGLSSFLASLLLSHLRLCLYISYFLVNDFRQISHMNGFSPVRTGVHAPGLSSFLASLLLSHLRL